MLQIAAELPACPSYNGRRKSKVWGARQSTCERDVVDNRLYVSSSAHLTATACVVGDNHVFLRVFWRLLS